MSIWPPKKPNDSQAYYKPTLPFSVTIIIYTEVLVWNELSALSWSEIDPVEQWSIQYTQGEIGGGRREKGEVGREEERERERSRTRKLYFTRIITEVQSKPVKQQLVLVCLLPFKERESIDFRILLTTQGHLEVKRTRSRNCYKYISGGFFRSGGQIDFDH